MKKISVAGRCRCGRARFVLREEPISFYLCHCTDCQAESGSAYGQTMHVRQGAIDAASGPIREHTMEWEDGGSSVIRYCANCLTQLFSGRANVPQVVGLNAGSLEATAGLQPYGNMWTRSARPWATFAAGPQYEQQPDDPLALIHAWLGRPGQSA